MKLGVFSVLLGGKTLADALDLVTACLCEAGCPSCAGPTGEADDGIKSAVLRILSAVLQSS